MNGILLLVIRPTTKLRWKSQDENSSTSSTGVVIRSIPWRCWMLLINRTGRGVSQKEIIK